MNRDDLLRLRAILDTIVQAPSGQSTAPTGSSSSSAAAIPRPTSQSQPSDSVPVASQVGETTLMHASTPIAPYQSARMTTSTGLPAAPRGHPSTPTAPNPAASQSFFGLENLGVGMRNQTNQRRLAAASSSRSSTRQARTAIRGRGPAIQPPALPRVTPPKIVDCLSGFHDNHGSPLMRLKVKVYPPRVCNLDFVNHDI